MAHAIHTRTEILQGLVALGRGLADAASVEDMADALSVSAVPLLGAANAAIGVVDDTKKLAYVYQGRTRTKGTAGIQVLEISEPTPLTDALRTGEPNVVVSTADFAARYPKIASRIEADEVTHMVTYPVVHNGAVPASVFFRFADGTPVDRDDRALMEEIVDMLRHAVVRAMQHDSLIEHVERLERSNRDLHDYASIVAHDLRAPARRITSFATLMLRALENEPEQAARHAAVIQEQVGRLDRLLTSILEYSSVVADPVAGGEAASLDQVIQGAAHALSEEVDDAGATIEWTDMPTVQCEPVLIQQVFQNLVENAIKYRHPDRPPVVSISASMGEVRDHVPWWRIQVADNGRGMAPEAGDAAFRMFSRLDPGDGLAGTGIGLAFAERAVERHGGDMGVESTLGEGSIFWFTLPGVATPDEL